jgi:hypothetical protein
MPKFILLFFFLIISPFHLYAQTGNENDVVIIKETPNAIYENSSEHNRINKTFQVSLIAVGFGPVSGTVGGVNLSYFFDRNSLLNLSFVRIRESSYSCSGSISCKATGNAFALSYKRFAGNSFYYTVGLGRREAGYEEIDVASGSPNYKFSGTAIGAEVSIGNQWQWKNFTLGCDWFGLNFPLSHKIDSEESSGTTWDDEDLKSREKEFLERTVAFGLRLYLGASF